MVSGLINANPVVYEKKERRARSAPGDVDEYTVEPIDQEEIFDILLYILDFCFLGLFSFHAYEIAGNSMVAKVLYFLTIIHHIRDIKDPEHPYSLEELKVITEDAIEVDDKRSHVR
ncbi:hypothetical protein BUALT_Bualt05G0041400 [Buddleja alternifolia]|uniref:Uncharacterized protein n=1 Tax=Buddleja alternifolia TaxID=168488 RepID=A0AAV6XGI3_9LAMI|nr:hypothetical protein BUALT_Bualt05G0041400 [Buddleja alternifolia]